LEGELGRNRIPYVKYGGFKFMESAHIKDVLTHLKAAANPKDRVGWIRILQLVEGIGPKTAAKIADMVALSGIPSDIAKFAAKYKKSAERLVELFTTIRDLASHTGSVPEKIERVISYYSDYMTAKYDNYPKRLRDLEQLADMSASYTDLSVFLSELALDPPDEDRSDEWARDNLVLSTIHSAKGLEWHTVIILWAVDGRIPSGKALSSPEEMEEERRLIYVAATRAKHNLVIAAPETSMDRVRGYTPTNLSLFFREAPEEYFRYTDDNRSRW
jgi:DNA helicase-2/ATP-dependent DNA helicase PcrA